MGRILVGGFLVASIIIFGCAPTLLAQTASCPDISGRWTWNADVVEWGTWEGCAGCETPAEPKATNNVSNDIQISQDFTDKCLFTAVRESTRTIITCGYFICEPGTEVRPLITRYVGVFHQDTTKITMQTRPQNTPSDESWSNPPFTLHGQITAVDKKTKKPTEIQFTMSGTTGLTWANAYAIVARGKMVRNLP